MFYNVFLLVIMYMIRDMNNIYDMIYDRNVEYLYFVLGCSKINFGLYYLFMC